MVTLMGRSRVFEETSKHCVMDVPEKNLTGVSKEYKCHSQKDDDKLGTLILENSICFQIFRRISQKNSLAILKFEELLFYKDDFLSNP